MIHYREMGTKSNCARRPDSGERVRRRRICDEDKKQSAGFYLVCGIKAPAVRHHELPQEVNVLTVPLMHDLYFERRHYGLMTTCCACL